MYGYAVSVIALLLFNIAVLRQSLSYHKNNNNSNGNTNSSNIADYDDVDENNNISVNKSNL